MSEWLFPYDRWDAALPTLMEEYASRPPFPHAHLTEFLDPAVVELLINEFADAGGNGKPWIRSRHYNERTLGLSSRPALPPFIGRVIDELNSDAFVTWLSALTGIGDLHADTTLEGGGMHQAGSGGFLNVHADFTMHHHRKGWKRRVNVIVYLNPSWRSEWGGAIELWDGGMRQPVVRVPPLANHAVIFNTDETSYHGYPDPLTCPKGVSRNSLALYYYTLMPDGYAGRSTNYQPRPADGLLKSRLIWADKTVLNLYSRMKSRFGLSDQFVSRALGVMERRRNGKS